MAKRLSKETLKIMEEYSTKEAETAEKSESSGDAADTNFFLSAVNNTGYDKAGAKDLDRVIRKERKLRRDLAMKTLTFKEKALTLWNYYVGNKNNYYPEMSTILGAELRTMKARSSELETIINQFENSGEKLDKYYFRILDEMEESHDAMVNSQTMKNELKGKILVIDNALRDTAKMEYSDRINLLRTKKKMSAEYAKQNLIWVDNGYNEHLRTHEIINLESMSDFINAMNSSSTLVLRFSKVLGDHIDNTRFIYDMVPKLFLKENEIELSQHKLAGAIKDYRNVLSDLYRHKFMKLGRLVGYDNAKEMLGPEIEKNINMLRSGD